MPLFPRKYFSLVFIFLLNSYAYSQRSDIKFERISINEGLSQNNVTSIVQDRRGFMWFGTLDGLNKFDGYTFKIYKHLPSDPNSLSANTISTIFADKSDNLWIGTMAAGLNKLNFRTEQFTRYQHEPDNEQSISGNRVRAILEDRSGNLWIGTRDGGLNVLVGATGTFYNFKNDPGNTFSLSDDHVRALLEDRAGNLWIGTHVGGLNLIIRNHDHKIDPDAVKFFRFQHNPENSKTLSNNHVEAIFEDNQGNLWIGTYGGGLDKLVNFKSHKPANSLNSKATFYDDVEVIHFELDPQNVSSLNNNFVEAIFEDHTGTLWVGTAQGGLNRFDPQTETFISYQYEPGNPNSLSYDNIEAIAEDRSGNLWIGTWGGGLNKVDRKGKKFSYFGNDPDDPNSLCYNYVRTIAEDPSQYLWVGTTGGGLDRFDRTSGRVLHVRKDPKRPNSLSSDDVRAICFDRQGYLWVGTYGGGVNKSDVRFSRSANSFSNRIRFKHYLHNSDDPGSLSNDFVWSIYEDKHGNIWVGTNEGLNKFDAITKSFKHYQHDPDNSNSISHNIARIMYQDSQDRFWVGTYHGLNRFDPLTETFIRYTNDPANPQSLSNNSVVTIFEDASGIIWIGTMGGGLNRFDPESKTFTHFLEKDGLPNTFVHSILGDNDGNLWLSTNKGLSKFNPLNPAGKRFRNYDVNDGLQSNEFNVGAVYQNSRGEMFFGGINGFNSFFPEQVIDSSYRPAVAITGFKIFNEEMNYGKMPDYIEEIELSYKQNFFSFEFAALDFTNSQKNQYAYMMEGFDPDWIYSGDRRFASYTNLDPGEYIFHVKGSNNDGLWNNEGTSVKLTISPPFWGTWWFRGLAVISTVAFLLLIYQNRVSSLKKGKVAQERFSKRLIEMQEKERKRIASELHDSLGQNLLVMKNSVDQYINTHPEGNKLVELTELSSLASESINEVREISYNLHPHQIDRLGLTKAVKSSINKISKSTSIHFSSDIDEMNSLFSKESDIHIFRIIQEGMNNLVRHANATEAKILVKSKGDLLNIVIKDNGSGFDFKSHTSPDSKEQGFGLTGISERVKILKGEFVVDSSENGTTLNIKIPV